MSEQEFCVLDELYFLQSFHELSQLTGLLPEELKLVLADMLQRGWVKCLRSREGEEPVANNEYLQHYSSYFYLATKAGLLAHNSR